jgi:hypothetical protein
VLERFGTLTAKPLANKAASELIQDRAQFARVEWLQPDKADSGAHLEHKDVSAAAQVLGRSGRAGSHQLGKLDFEKRLGNMGALVVAQDQWRFGQLARILETLTAKTQGYTDASAGSLLLAEREAALEPAERFDSKSERRQANKRVLGLARDQMPLAQAGSGQLGKADLEKYLENMDAWVRRPLLAEGEWRPLVTLRRLLNSLLT